VEKPGDVSKQIDALKKQGKNRAAARHQRRGRGALRGAGVELKATLAFARGGREAVGLMSCGCWRRTAQT